MKTKKKLIVCCLSFALLLGMIPSNEISAAKKVSLNSTKLTVTKGESKTLKVKNTNKKVTWNILSGKKYITLKTKGNTAATIKGKKKGTAKVQAAVGTKKLTCNVTVKETENNDTPNPDTAETPAPSASTQPEATTSSPAAIHAADVAALTELIAKQREEGATVSEDINSDEYTWEDGRLTQIYWPLKTLSGNLDVSKLVNLTSLDCSGNRLYSLNVSKNVNLESLNCSNNHNRHPDEPIRLDVTNNRNLKSLNCSNNRLDDLDVTNNVNLTSLNCSNNQLKSLDVTNNTNLKFLYCPNNWLYSLDVTNNKKLIILTHDEIVTVTGYNN